MGRNKNPGEEYANMSIWVTKSTKERFFATLAYGERQDDAMKRLLYNWENRTDEEPEKTGSSEN